MSLCGICYAEIEDGEPMDFDHLSYDGCEEPWDIYREHNYILDHDN